MMAPNSIILTCFSTESESFRSWHSKCDCDTNYKIDKYNNKGKHKNSEFRGKSWQLSKRLPKLLGERPMGKPVANPKGPALFLCENENFIITRSGWVGEKWWWMNNSKDGSETQWRRQSDDGETKSKWVRRRFMLFINVHCLQKVSHDVRHVIPLFYFCLPN